MKNWGKIFALAVIAVLLVCFAGCCCTMPSSLIDQEQGITPSNPTTQSFTKEIAVEVTLTGEPAEGFLADSANISASPKTISISGPKDLIDQITIGKIFVNMDGVQDTVEQERRIVLCDSNGNPLEADLSEVLVKNHIILVRVPLLKEKEISLLLPVIPNGMLTAANVTVKKSMSKITVSGDPAIIDRMSDTIILGNLDLSKENEDFSNREYNFTLPNGVKCSAGTTVYVSLTLPPKDPISLPDKPTIPLPDIETPEKPDVVRCSWRGLRYYVGSEYSTEFNDSYVFHTKDESNLTVEYYTANNAFTDTYEYLEDYMQQMTAMGNTCQIYESNGVYYTLTHWWYGHHEIRAFYMMDGYVLTIHGRTTEYSEEIPALIDYVTSGKTQ